MNTNKIFKILLLITIVFFSMSLVSAEGNFTDLQNQIANATSNELILNQDYKYINEDDDGLKSGIYIDSDNFILDGNGFTVDGDNKARIFNIIGNNVTIKNINLINGNISGDGGAILNTGNNFTILNSNFTNNNADNGGAIANTECTNFTVKNSYFTNNTANTNGGAIYSSSSRYSSSSDVDIYNSSFINNTANNAYGGAIYSYIQSHSSSSSSDVDVYNSNFINNTANWNGGAIYSYSASESSSSSCDVDVYNSSFINNNAIRYGGAIYSYSHSYSYSSSDVNVYNSSFINNTATYDAGAIYSYGYNYNDNYGSSSSSSDVNVYNSSFINNTANNGGAIYSSSSRYSSSSDVYVCNSSFINNTATNGGAIYSQSNQYGGIVNVTGSVFINNTAILDGGAIYVDKSNLDVKYSIFYDNGVGDNETIFVGSSLSSVDLSCNFWGDNNPNFTNLINSSSTYVLEDFIQVFLVISSENDTLYKNDNLNYYINITLNDTSNLDTSKLPDILVNLKNSTDDVLNTFIAQFYDVNNPGNTSITENNLFRLNLYYFDTLLNSVIYSVLPQNNITINLDDDYTFVYGENININGTITGLVDGDWVNVTLTTKDKNYTVLTNGTFVFNIGTWTSGTYNIIVSFNGSNKYSANKTQSQLIVVKGVSILDASNITIMYKDGRYVVVLRDGLGNLIKGVKVNITVNGVPYTKITDENGTAYLTINLNPNKYNITSVFSGNENYTNSSIKTFLTVQSPLITGDLVKYYRNESQYIIQVVDKDNNGVSGVNVTFNINGVIYTRTTNSTGHAKLNINLNPGEYIITTTYGDLNVSNSVFVNSTLIGGDLNKTFAEKKTYNVKVLDGKGNILVGETVSININGVIYDKVTNDDGIARLEINLNPGSYIATATWNNYSTSNKIRVI